MRAAQAGFGVERIRTWMILASTMLLPIAAGAYWSCIRAVDTAQPRWVTHHCPISTEIEERQKVCDRMRIAADTVCGFHGHASALCEAGKQPYRRLCRESHWNFIANSPAVPLLELSEGSTQEVTTFTHDSECVRTGICECPKGHVCDVAISKQRMQQGVVFKGKIRSFKCTCEHKHDTKICERFQLESTYEEGTEIECVVADMGKETCQHATFTGSIKSVLCEAARDQENVIGPYSADGPYAYGVCRNMTVHSTFDIATNVTCRMGPSRLTSMANGVCERAQIRGLIGHVGCFGQATCSKGFSVIGAESLTCGSPACTDENSDGTEAKCIAEASNCDHNNGPVCEEIKKSYSQQGFHEHHSKNRPKICHMTGRIEVRGTFTCHHGACVQVGLFACPMSMNDGQGPKCMRKLKENTDEQDERLRTWGKEPSTGWGVFPGCMETVKAKKLRCVDAQITTPNRIRLYVGPDDAGRIGAPCNWFAPVEAEKVECIANLHMTGVDTQRGNPEQIASCYGMLKITATRMDCRGVGSCWRTGALGLSVKSLNCDGANVCFRAGSLSKDYKSGLPSLFTAFETLARSTNGRVWTSVNSLQCKDHRFALTRKGTYPASHEHVSWGPKKNAQSPSCYGMAVKTSSISLNEDFNTLCCRWSDNGALPIELKPRGRKLKLECKGNTYLRGSFMGGNDQSHIMSSSCAYSLTNALNLTSLEAGGLAAITVSGQFVEYKHGSSAFPVTLNHFLKDQGVLDGTCKAFLDPDSAPTKQCSSFVDRSNCDPFELNQADGTIKSVTKMGTYLGYSGSCVGHLLGSDACPVQPQLTYCLKTNTCELSPSACQGMSKCRQDALELSAFDPTVPPVPTRTSAWDSELGYELFGLVHVGSPRMRIFSGVSSPRHVEMKLQDTLFKIPEELTPTCCQRFLVPALYALMDQKVSMDNDIGGTAIIEVCGGGASGSLIALSHGDSKGFRLGVTGAVLSQRDREEKDATANTITPNNAWEVLAEKHEVDTFISKHTVADSTACVYNGALKLKAQPAGDADVTTPVLNVPQECMPTNAQQYKVLANVYNGDASSLPASDREVQHYLYFEGSTLTMFSRTPPSAELVLGLDGLVFIGPPTSRSMVKDLSVGEALVAPAIGELQSSKPLIKELEEKVNALQSDKLQLQSNAHRLQSENRKLKGGSSMKMHRNLGEAEKLVAAELEANIASCQSCPGVCPGGLECTSCKSGSRECHACPDGKFSPNGVQSCEVCPSGYASTAGNAACDACPEGLSSNPGDAVCSKNLEYSQTTAADEGPTINLQGRSSAKKACESCAQMEWWGKLAERLCSFKPGPVKFVYDSVSKSLVGNMADDRDADGLSICRPLSVVLVLAAAISGNMYSHLAHAVVVQVEPHGVLRTFPTNSASPETSMDIELSGAMFSPRQAVQVADLMRLHPSCVAKCFPENIHTQQLHGQNETSSPFSCIKMCTPKAEEKSISSDECACTCTMVKRLECSPSAQGTSCMQYKELLSVNAEIGCDCSKRCERQLSGF
jgi:hypothetical protein